MISVRPSKPKDIPAISDFQVRLAEESERIKLDKELLTSGLHALFEDPSRGRYYVAESDGKIIGCFLITYEWSDWRNSTVWWLQSVYVAGPNRQQGVFRKMYNYVIEAISRDPKIIGLRLYVDKSNGHAQKVYHSLGMNGDHYTVFEWMKK